MLTLGLFRLLVTSSLAMGLVAQFARRGHATRHRLRKPARCVGSVMKECMSRSRYPVQLHRPMELAPPWPPLDRGLLHLDVLDSGSYVSRRAKQLGKVRETRFVWATLATAQPSSHPKRPGPRLGPHATHYLKNNFFDMFRADLHLDMTYVGTPTFVLSCSCSYSSAGNFPMASTSRCL